ncbi:hypothetical protein [Chitinophaga sp. Cy-1792]|uniref:hypothetical protein n=1 Tax=Chitinophaga sp. Cy-1792 TaxID=2608339 RepID=UPI00141F3EAF|nr:hypothetical protein [Chitinophaga sp. Cy-1792]NIG56497.1 hypothetical protein [Chitinophaga sp. Cy-1792]
MNRKIPAMLLILLMTCLASAQTKSYKINVSKQECPNKNGFCLNVEVSRYDTVISNLNEQSFYNYEEIYMLPDAVKIKVIEALLPYLSDSSLCCRKVRTYENMEYPGCYRERPVSTNFPINIETLFIINRVAYNPFTFRIGCYPVLYSMGLEREINNDQQQIKLMVAHYKEWFKLYKSTGELPPNTILNAGKIRWWGHH